MAINVIPMAAALTEELDNPHAVFLVAADGERVLGYAGMHHIGDEGYIDNVAVLPEARRQGVARLLMAALEAYGREHAMYRLTLEVRASNAAAISLYSKFGFEKVGERKDYYSSPKENAILMTKYF